MRWFSIWIWLCIFVFDTNGFIVPDEVPTALSVIYSNIPKIKLGSDSRIGWGFRFGDRADAQVLLELGPQQNTQPLANQKPFDNPNYPELSSSLDTEDYDDIQEIPEEDDTAVKEEREDTNEEDENKAENINMNENEESVIKLEIESLDNLLSKLTEKVNNISSTDHFDIGEKAEKVINNLIDMLEMKISEEKIKLKKLKEFTEGRLKQTEDHEEKDELKELMIKLKNYLDKTSKYPETENDVVETTEIETLKQLVKKLGDWTNPDVKDENKPLDKGELDTINAKNIEKSSNNEDKTIKSENEEFFQDIEKDKPEKIETGPEETVANSTETQIVLDNELIESRNHPDDFQEYFHTNGLIVTGNKLEEGNLLGKTENKKELETNDSGMREIISEENSKSEIMNFELAIKTNKTSIDNETSYFVPNEEEEKADRQCVAMEGITCGMKSTQEKKIVIQLKDRNHSTNASDIKSLEALDGNVTEKNIVTNDNTLINTGLMKNDNSVNIKSQRNHEYTTEAETLIRMEKEQDSTSQVKEKNIMGSNERTDQVNINFNTGVTKRKDPQLKPNNDDEKQETVIIKQEKEKQQTSTESNTEVKKLNGELKKMVQEEGTTTKVLEDNVLKQIGNYSFSEFDLQILDESLRKLRLKLNKQLKFWHDNSEIQKQEFLKNLKILKFMEAEKRRNFIEINWREKYSDYMDYDYILEGPSKGILFKTFRTLSSLWVKQDTDITETQTASKINIKTNAEESNMNNNVTDLIESGTPKSNVEKNYNIELKPTTTIKSRVIHNDKEMTTEDLDEMTIKNGKSSSVIQIEKNDKTTKENPKHNFLSDKGELEENDTVNKTIDDKHDRIRFPSGNCTSSIEEVEINSSEETERNINKAIDVDYKMDIKPANDSTVLKTNDIRNKQKERGNDTDVGVILPTTTTRIITKHEEKPRVIQTSGRLVKTSELNSTNHAVKEDNALIKTNIHETVPSANMNAAEPKNTIKNNKFEWAHTSSDTNEITITANIPLLMSKMRNTQKIGKETTPTLNNSMPKSGNDNSLNNEIKEEVIRKRIGIVDTIEQEYKMTMAAMMNPQRKNKIKEVDKIEKSKKNGTIQDKNIVKMNSTVNLPTEVSKYFSTNMTYGAVNEKNQLTKTNIAETKTSANMNVVKPKNTMIKVELVRAPTSNGAHVMEIMRNVQKVINIPQLMNKRKNSDKFEKKTTLPLNNFTYKEENNNLLNEKMKGNVTRKEIKTIDPIDQEYKMTIAAMMNTQRKNSVNKKNVTIQKKNITKINTNAYLPNEMMKSSSTNRTHETTIISTNMDAVKLENTMKKNKFERARASNDTFVTTIMKNVRKVINIPQLMNKMGNSKKIEKKTTPTLNNGTFKGDNNNLLNNKMEGSVIRKEIKIIDPIDQEYKMTIAAMMNTQGKNKIAEVNKKMKESKTNGTIQGQHQAKINSTEGIVKYLQQKIVKSSSTKRKNEAGLRMQNLTYTKYSTNSTTDKNAIERKTIIKTKTETSDSVDNEYKMTMEAMGNAKRLKNMENITTKKNIGILKKMNISTSKTTKPLIAKNEKQRSYNGENMRIKSAKTVDEEYKMTMTAMNKAQGNKFHIYSQNDANQKQPNLVEGNMNLRKYQGERRGWIHQTKIPSTSPYMMKNIERNNHQQHLGGRMMSYIRQILQRVKNKIQVK